MRALMPQMYTPSNIIEEFPLQELRSETRSHSKRKRMKFSQTLEFNAVDEWRSHYIDYESLKKVIFALEKESLRIPSADEPRATERPEDIFKRTVDTEVEKVNSFYCKLESKFTSTYETLKEHVDGFLLLRRRSSFCEQEEQSDTGSSEDEQIQPLQCRRRRSSVSARGLSGTRNPNAFRRIQFKRDLASCYVSLNELLSFMSINHTGIRKALKKFDKTLGTAILRPYMQDTVDQTYVFRSSTNEALKARIEATVSLYAELETKGDVEKATEVLKTNLREHVVWERNTVWRDLISMERRHQAVNPEDLTQKVAKPLYIFGINIPPALVHPKTLKLVLISLVFFLLLLLPTLESVSQSNCLALLVLASLLWATETLPLFVTSLLIPFLVVVLRVPLRSSGERMDSPEAANFVFSQMWSSVITVLLGGFALAAALSKYNIAKVMATMILSRAGTDPKIIALVLMFVAAFLCMWISNVAAPVLLFSVAQPLLRTLPARDNFSKVIVLGISLASNVGGMISPIASPQNIIALENLDPQPSWLEWFLVAIPVAVISIILIWVLLVVTFPPSRQSAMVGHIRGTRDKIEFVHIYIVFVTILTIVLWCITRSLEPTVGNMGVLALVPLVLLFGPGILSPADFNNFLWTIVALAMGGVVLGKAVESCGLLKTIAQSIQGAVSGFGLYGVCAIFGLAIVTVASFISHTVAALIVLPLVKSIGEQMDDPHPRILVMVSALLCSAAMALPTSSFPNATAICMTDDLGQPYLTVKDFITRGAPASLLSYAVILTVGYVILRLLGF